MIRSRPDNSKRAILRNIKSTVFILCSLANNFPPRPWHVWCAYHWLVHESNPLLLEVLSSGLLGHFQTKILVIRLCIRQSPRESSMKLHVPIRSGDLLILIRSMRTLWHSRRWTFCSSQKVIARTRKTRDSGNSSFKWNNIRGYAGGRVRYNGQKIEWGRNRKRRIKDKASRRIMTDRFHRRPGPSVEDESTPECQRIVESPLSRTVMYLQMVFARIGSDLE